MISSHGLPAPQALDIHGQNCAEKWRRFEIAWHNFSLATELDKKDEKIQIATLLTIIGEEAREVFSTFQWSSAEDDRKIAEVLKRFREYCQPSKNIPFERYLFNGRDQELDETYDHYRTALRKLAENCEFHKITPDEILRDRLVFGVSDDKIRERLLREPNLTLEKTDSICRATESMKSQMKMVQGKEHIDAVQSKSHKECWFCGRQHDFGRKYCPAYGKQCTKCGKNNHFAAKCKSKQIQKPVHNVIENTPESDIYSVDVCAISNDSEFVSLMLSNGSWIKFQGDTGAQCNVLPLNIYKMHTGDKNLNNMLAKRSVITAYGGTTIDVLGEVALNVSRNGKNYVIVCKIIDNSSVRPLLGRQACLDMNIVKYLDNDAINPPNLVKSKVLNVNSPAFSEIEKLCSLYPNVFCEGAGKLQGEYRIKIDETANPVQHPPRRVPAALHEKLKVTLNNMVKEGIIARVEEPTQWVNSIVVVTKKDGNLRICLDPRELNKWVQREHYPLPTIEEISTRFCGAKVFSVLDVKCGFHHLALDRESSFLTTFNSPFGRYRFLRLPFGICSAPEIFQRTMHQLIEGLNGVEVIADDFIILGVGDTMDGAMKNHDENLHAFLGRCKETGLHLNTGKLQLRKTEVPFIGHLATRHGLKVDPLKVKAIEEMPVPNDSAGVLRFLGMVNYLSRFLPNLSDIAKPLRDLIAKDSIFRWDSPQNSAWLRIKDIVSSAPVLRYYSLQDEVTIQCDASGTGLGACLMQNGQPVAYASRALTTTEVQYAQIEKELLAIVFACEHFDVYLYGREKVTVESDHKPLENIFRKPLHTTPMRLQRMLLRLQRYSLNVIYKRGKDMVLADTLSRAHASGIIASIKDDEFENVDHKESLPISNERWKQITKASEEDKIFEVLRDIIRNGWPLEKKDVPECVRQYFEFRNELTIQGDLIFKGMQLIVPSILRKEMIITTHSSHIGIEGCLRRMRECLFWPRMSSEVKDWISKCDVCMTFRNSQAKEPMWLDDQVHLRPWSKVAADVCNLHGRQLLVVVDYFSNFIEVSRLTTLTSQATVRALGDIFARFGVPDVLITDNGTNFSSEEFAAFSRKWRFNHVTSSPGYAQSNGKAENAVQTVKRLFNKCKEVGESEFLALLDWRNTPTEGLESSPAQRLMGRRCKTLLPMAAGLLRPRNSEMEKDRAKLAVQKEKQRRYYNRNTKKLPQIRPNQSIRMRLPGEKRWSWGVCKGMVGPRSYDVLVQNRVYRRNRRHLLDLREPPPYESATTDDLPVDREDSNPKLTGSEPNETASPQPQEDLRRSTRIRKQTDFYKST